MKTSKQARPLLGCSLCSCLFFLSLLGCDEVYQSTYVGCMALVDACQGDIVPEADELYCLQVIESEGNDEKAQRSERLQCEAFRRGQLCQCVTPVCYEFLLADAMAPDGQTDMDIWVELYNWQCPTLSLTP